MIYNRIEYKMFRLIVIFGVLAVFIYGILSCQSNQSNHAVRNFFPDHLDTTWFNDTNYWWVDRYAHPDYSHRHPYYKVVINTDYYKIDGYVCFVDSVLYISFDPRNEDEIFIDFRNPFCSFLNSSRTNISITRIGDLPIFDDAFPQSDYIFLSFSLEDGLLGMAFNDTLSHEITYAIGKYWCCDTICDIPYVE